MRQPLRPVRAAAPLSAPGMFPLSATYDGATIRAMISTRLNPGHSDLDDEQPMEVHVTDADGLSLLVHVTLGDIRRAKMEVRG